MTSAMMTLINDPQRSTLFKQGAEAKVYVANLFPAPLVTNLEDGRGDAGAGVGHDLDPAGRLANQTSSPTRALFKHRFLKKYRHQSLSTQLTASRTTAEARALVRCAKAGVNTPAILCVDEALGLLGLEIIEGKSVRELLGGGSEGDELEMEADDCRKSSGEEASEEVVMDDESALKVMKLVGTQLARMHQAHVIHGDLTTSNMLVRTGTLEVVLIDFGLSSTSTLAEDKAVDLYVLERAFQSTHPSSDHLFGRVLEAYGGTLQSSLARPINSTSKSHFTAGPTNWKEVQKRLEDVRLRGRKRSMVG